VNPRVAGWFEAGDISEALLGEGSFFIPDTTYRDQHDRLLVLDQLLRWGVGPRRELAAGEAFLDALARAVHRKDGWLAYDLVWCHLLAARESERQLPLDLDAVRRCLDEVDASADAPSDATIALRSSVRTALDADELRSGRSR
jgi:hypothetical protein